MTAEEFDKWIKGFIKEMERKKYNVLLLVDNAPYHNHKS
jgi:hypothetical protein